MRARRQWVSAFTALLRRDLILGYRYLADAANPLLLFLMVVTLFPVALGPDQAVLQSLAPGIIWVAALLASALSLDSLFRSDYEDGSLEQILLSPESGPVLIGAKITAHWLLSGLPMILFALLMSFFLYLPASALVPLLLTLLLGTQALIILPLYIPLLIFAVAAVNNAVQGLPISAELYFLSALLALALTLAPLAVVSSLRIRIG